MQAPMLQMPETTLGLEISLDEFRLTARLIKEHFGIHLADSKRAMVASRLYRLVREQGFRSYGEFCAAQLVQPSQETLSALVDCISTNHTYFNREPEHFWFLRDKVLPPIIANVKKSGPRDLRVWCAAASSGEEPYTLAMVIREALGSDHPNWQAGLLATDISQQALQKGINGVYATEAVKTLPAPYADRYFDHRPDGTSKVIPNIQREVTFRRFNLRNTTFPFRQPFHAIFCRNVMIYFEDDFRRELLARMSSVLVQGGYFFVGHAETISGLTDNFRVISPGVYRKEVP
jgi:chemotaxis protein methyltransferase CheR